jgi:hypothetical protein
MLCPKKFGLVPAGTGELADRDLLAGKSSSGYLGGEQVSGQGWRSI